MSVRENDPLAHAGAQQRVAVAVDGTHLPGSP